MLYNLALLQVPYVLMVLAALVVLIWRRRRSLRATAIGLAALSGFAGWFVFDWLLQAVGWDLLNRSLDFDNLRALVLAVNVCRSTWYGACVLLLFFAVISDRPGAKTDSPTQVPSPSGVTVHRVSAETTEHQASERPGFPAVS